MSSNPYPYFDDSWNNALLGFAVANALALLMWLFLGDHANLGRITDPAWVPSGGGVVLFFFYGACVVATLILWVNMWMYWARIGRPLLWMFLLLIGAWGTSVAFLFLVYRKDLEAFKRHEEQDETNSTGF